MTKFQCCMCIIPSNSIVMEGVIWRNHVSFHNILNFYFHFLYREGNFCAQRDGKCYSSSIRNTSCHLLTDGTRCSPCSRVRNILRKRHSRAEEKKDKQKYGYIDYMSGSKWKHSNMSRKELASKLNQQKSKIKHLHSENEKLRRKFRDELTRNGIQFNESQNFEIIDLLNSSTSEVQKAFPDSNSYQRLFWEE